MAEGKVSGLDDLHEKWSANPPNRFRTLTTTTRTKKDPEPMKTIARTKAKQCAFTLPGSQGRQRLMQKIFRGLEPVPAVVRPPILAKIF
jgi:hypothetical protein